MSFPLLGSGQLPQDFITQTRRAWKSLKPLHVHHLLSKPEAPSRAWAGLGATAGKVGDPRSPRSQVPHPPPGWSTCQAATQTGAKWGGSPNLPKPDRLVWALVREVVRDRAVVASQGELVPKGRDRGEKEEGGRREPPEVSLETRGSPGDRPQGPGEVVQDPLTLEQIFIIKHFRHTPKERLNQ